VGTRRVDRWMLLWTENTHMVSMNWTQQKAHSSLCTRNKIKQDSTNFVKTTLIIYFYLPAGASVHAVALPVMEYFPATHTLHTPDDM